MRRIRFKPELHGTWKRTIQEANTLQRINRTISSTLDLDEVLRRLIAEITVLLAAQSASVILHDEERQEAVLTTTYGKASPFQTIRYPLAGSLTEWVATKQRSLRVPRLMQEAWPTVWRLVQRLETSPEPTAVLLAPLWDQETVVGSLEVIWEPGHVITDHEERLLEALAVQASIAITNARLFQEKECALQQARESEERYRTLFENANDALATVALDRTVTAVNRAMERLLGYSQAEILGRDFYCFLTPEAVALTKEREQRLQAGEKISSLFEHEFVRKDGSRVWVEGRTRFLRDRAGAVIGFQGTFRDITERKQHDAALHTSEERFRAQYQGIPIPTYTWRGSGTDLILIDYNEAAHVLTRGAIIGMVGKTAQELYPDEPEILRDLQHCLTEKTTIRREASYRLRTTGEHKYLMVSCVFVPPDMVMVHTEDITERQRTEEALEEEVQIAAALVRVGRSLISSLDTPVLLQRLCQLTATTLGTDSSHTLLWQPEAGGYRRVAEYGNPQENAERTGSKMIPRSWVENALARLAWDEVVEIRRGDATNVFCAELMHSYGATTGLLMGLWRGDTLIGFQTAFHHEVGLPFPSWRKRIARGIAQLTSMALDNARLLEQAQSANRLKSAFLATISHELRTPFNVILGYAELLLEGEFGPLEAAQAKPLRQLDHAARGLFDLVSALLDASQLEAGRLPVTAENVELHSFLTEIKQDIDRGQATQGLHWDWCILPDVSYVHTDRTKLRVILKSLLNNAMKFTHEGSITILVSARRGGAEFCITDTGIGIAPDILPVIFEPFQQGDSSMTRRYEGVGLGLYLVRRLVEILGGTIMVDSQPGGGSTFRVWLPIHESTEPAAASEEERF